MKNFVIAIFLVVIANALVVEYHHKDNRTAYSQFKERLAVAKCWLPNSMLLFAYSLTYPDNYKPALQRLFSAVEAWNVLGAYC